MNSVAPPRIDFVSDNVSSMAPEALAAVVEANAGYASAYGSDPYSQRAADLLRGLLDVDAEVHLVSSGTAANAIALSALCRPFEAVAAHAHAHIFTDEAAAPAFFGHGLGSIPLPGASGRIAPAGLADALAREDVSSSQGTGALSISNATEYGAVYGEAELSALAGAAREAGVGLHLDGARLCNAAAAGFDLRCLGRLGFDVIVIGGAKSGLPATEAIVLLNPVLARRFRTRLKQAGQLASKARFGAAAWVGMLEGGAWIERSRHANAMARKLAAMLDLPLAHPVETNAVFVRLAEDAHRRLREAGWQAFRFADGSVRFMCSWATTDGQVEELAAAVAAVA